MCFFEVKEIHSGVFKDYQMEDPILEIFSNAACVADRQIRRSVSGSVIFFGTCMVYSSSRSQKVVSLSSAESETYFAASAVMGAILIQSIFAWLLECHMLMCLYLDPFAARVYYHEKG